MNNLFFYDVKYENICKNGIFVLYNSYDYKIKEFNFNIRNKNFDVELNEIYSYFMEDSHYYSISEYLIKKYKTDDVIVLAYYSFDLDISIKNKELYDIIKNELIYNYKSDLTSFSK